MMRRSNQHRNYYLSVSLLALVSLLGRRLRRALLWSSNNRHRRTVGLLESCHRLSPKSLRHAPTRRLRRL